ncbi:MAG: PQQ-binding-like beta-propeller repeat protein [Acidimicrobiales bacterium]
MRQSAWRHQRSVVVLLTMTLAGCGNGGRSAVGRSGTKVAEASRPSLQQEWAWAPPPPASAGMPAADATGVALTAGRHTVVLLDDSGAVRWSAERIGVRDVAPLLAPEVVVVAADDGVIAYDRDSGRLRWEAALGERANTPVMAGGAAVVTTWEGSLIALDQGDGSVRWRTRLGGDALGPAAAAEAVVVATFDSGEAAGVVAVDAATGRHRWSTELPPGGVSAPAVVVVGEGDGGGRGGGPEAVTVTVAGDAAARGLSLDAGAERWRQPVEGAGSPEVAPLALGGTVLVPDRQGALALLDARTGSERWTASSGEASVRGGPAGPGPGGWFALPLDDGRLLMAGADREPAVLEPPDGLVAGVARGPGGVLLIASGQGRANALTASYGW